jgi:hypothetical protein
MRKTNKIIAIALILLSAALLSTASADYYLNEKPVIGLTQNTAYTLNSGEWLVDNYGWVNYGVAERLQVSTNALLDIFQYGNANVKAALIKETEKSPAVSLGASYYGTLNGSSAFWDASIYLSKAVIENEHWMYGALKYSTGDFTTQNKFSITADKVLDVSFGAVYTHRTTYLRSYYEAGVYAISGFSRLRAGLGVEWALKEMRFRLGGFTTGDQLLVPVIDLNWRF